MKNTIQIASMLMALGVVGCGGFRPFPLRAPMQIDHDRRPLATAPDEYFSSFLWDGADQMAFRPFAKFWKVSPGGVAINVNSLDEVADSSWFTNRMGQKRLTLAAARRGPCSGPGLDPKGPWTVVGAKPNGQNPGFPIKAADGRRYMVKFDGIVQGPRATAADTIVSKIYHAAGYFVPCNEVVFFDRKILKIDPKAMSENNEGDKVAMQLSHLDTIFAKALRLKDGRYRASASLFLKGKPIGPFRYQNTRDDDPNDVVPHEDRRELRASYVLAGLVNHFDSREQNTLDMFVETEGRGGYVQHNILDFGDCFGSIWEPPMLGRRIGHSHYFALDHVVEDFVGFGLRRRPWQKNRFGPSGKVFGYYKVADFVPDRWRPGYPNPAMLRMTERDGAWMARILAHITPDHLRAMISAGKIHNRALELELTRLLLGRRMKTLARYLDRVSPLTHPAVINDTANDKAALCMEDLTLTARLFEPAMRTYAARAWLGPDLEPIPLSGIRTVPRLCVELPNVPGSSAAHPQYLIIDFFAYSGGSSRHPARVHLYHMGGHAYRIVGLERPEHGRAPGQ